MKNTIEKAIGDLKQNTANTEIAFFGGSFTAIDREYMLSLLDATKPYIDKLEQPVMYAEKSWGSFRVLDVEKGSMTIKVTLTPGHRMNYHSHERRDEVWTVISGTGRTIVDGMEQNVKAGDVITMQAGCRHTVIADSELQLIEIQLGKEISVSDKKKYKFDEE